MKTRAEATPMPYEFKMKRRVEFSDTDMAGIMHFSNYFRFMEATEHAFFRSLGMSVHRRSGGTMQGWARVHARCDYERPLRYEDVVEIHLLVREVGGKSMTYDFVFRRESGDRGPAEPVARGSVTVACVARGPEEDGLRAVSVPEEVSARIQAAPHELLD